MPFGNTKKFGEITNSLTAINKALDALQKQVASQQNAIDEIHRDANTPQPDNQPAAEPNPDILRAAAGIAHATLEAHRDTWAFLIQVAGNEQHFHIPGRVKDHNGFVTVRFSGPSLVAAITSLHHINRTAPNPVTRAIADHIHGKITAAVQAVIDNPHHGDGKLVRIVIDDRPARDDEPAKP